MIHQDFVHTTEKQDITEHKNGSVIIVFVVVIFIAN